MDKRNIDLEISRYIKQAKALLPVYGKRERAFIGELTASIEECFESSSSIDMEQIRSRFGTPPDAVSEYLSNVDADYLLGQVKRIKHIRAIVFALVAFVILSIGIKMGLNYKNYLDAKNAYVDATETVVERD
jgi:hypothetical protein